MLKNLEISVIRNDSLILDYNRLSKKQQKKLYSLAALSLATLDLNELAKMKVAPNFSVFNPVFGAIPTWTWLLFIGIIIGTALLVTITRVDWRKDNLLENLFYLLLAIAPAVYVVLVAMGIC